MDTTQHDIRIANTQGLELLYLDRKSGNIGIGDTAPEAITAEPAGTRKIKIDWSTVTKAKFYELWRAERDPQKPEQELVFELIRHSPKRSIRTPN